MNNMQVSLDKYDIRALRNMAQFGPVNVREFGSHSWASFPDDIPFKQSPTSLRIDKLFVNGLLSAVYHYHFTHYAINDAGRAYLAALDAKEAQP